MSRTSVNIELKRKRHSYPLQNLIAAFYNPKYNFDNAFDEYLIPKITEFYKK